MARHSNPIGRFSIDYERKSIFDGIEAELRQTVGQVIDWLVFDPAETQQDPIYEVASIGEGRRWKQSISIKTYASIVFQGASPINERGFYNTDILRASFSADKIIHAMPDIVSQPDRHIMDRIAYRGRLFVPHTLWLKGLLENEYTVITVDAYQQNPEEVANDLQMSDNEIGYSVVGAMDDIYTADFSHQETEEDRSLPVDWD